MPRSVPAPVRDVSPQQTVVFSRAPFAELKRKSSLHEIIIYIIGIYINILNIHKGHGAMLDALRSPRPASLYHSAILSPPMMIHTALLVHFFFFFFVHQVYTVEACDNKENRFVHDLLICLPRLLLQSNHFYTKMGNRYYWTY